MACRNVERQRAKGMAQISSCCRRGFELDMDDARFINHSPEPNMGYLSMEDTRSFALRDIKKGEELFEDYNGYDYTISPPEWLANLYLEYGIDESFVGSR